MPEPQGLPGSRVFNGKMDESLEAYLTAVERAAEANVRHNHMVATSHQAQGAGVLAAAQTARSASSTSELAALLKLVSSNPT